MRDYYYNRIKSKKDYGSAGRENLPQGAARNAEEAAEVDVVRGKAESAVNFGGSGKTNGSVH